MSHRDVTVAIAVDTTKLDDALVTATAAACAVCRDSPPGAWPRWFDGTHCRTCHASWSGHSTTHCVSCHRTFSTHGTCDRHQTSERDENDDLNAVCHDPATVTDRKGVRIFGDPVPNRHGTPVWRRASGKDESDE